MAAIFGEKIFFDILDCLDILRVKNFDKSALSRTVKELAKILRFAVFAKNSKIQNGRHFWRENFFFDILDFFDTLRVKNFDEILYVAPLRS